MEGCDHVWVSTIVGGRMGMKWGPKNMISFIRHYTLVMFYEPDFLKVY